MTPAERHLKALHEATREAWERACDYYSVRCAMPRIDVTLRGQVAGQAVWREERRRVFRRRNEVVDMLLRFNLEAYDLAPEYVLSTVIPHEVAHLFVRFLFPKKKVRPHGKEWRSVMQDCFEISHPSRTHRLNLSSRRHYSRSYRYRCHCGNDHMLTAIRHNRVQKGSIYVCRFCQKPLEFVGYTKSVSAF